MPAQPPPGVRGDARFAPRAVAALGVRELAALTPEQYEQLIPGTALARASTTGCGATPSMRWARREQASARPLLEKLSGDSSELVRSAAQWALRQLDAVSDPPRLPRRRSGGCTRRSSFQVLISAGTYLAGKRAMEELPPITVVLWRFLLSGAVFVLLLLADARARSCRRAREWRRVLLLGLLAGPVNQMLFFSGLARSTAAHAALLYALTPLGVYVLSLVRGPRAAPRARATAGILTAFAGVVVLLLGRGLARRAGLAAGATCSSSGRWWRGSSTPRRAGPSPPSTGPMRATAWSMVAATLLMLPLAPFAPKPVEVLDGEPRRAQGCIVYLALLTSVVAYLLWYYALSKVPASKVAIFSNLQPAATALAAWLPAGRVAALGAGGGRRARPRRRAAHAGRARAGSLRSCSRVRSGRPRSASAAQESRRALAQPRR